jgi:hypothetical protein
MARAVSGDHNRSKLAIDVCPIPFNNQGKTTVMKHNHSSKPSFARLRSPKFLRKSAAFLGLGFWASSLALISPTAQSQSSGVPYCFDVQMSIDVYESPSFRSRKIAAYTNADIAYATTNRPISVGVNDGTADGNSFVQVKIYDGSSAWVPRYPEGSNSPALIDLEGFDDCSATGEGPPANEYCFSVQRPTNVYARPSYDAMLGARYVAGDTAYATTNPPTSVWVRDSALANGNSFIEVEIYDGNIAWVPRFRADADVPLLVDLAECP